MGKKPHLMSTCKSRHFITHPELFNLVLIRAGSGVACNPHILLSDKRSRFYYLIIKALCFISVMTPRCVCGTPHEFSIPKFESLTGFSYKSPSDSTGKTVELSDDTLLLTPDPKDTITERELHYVGRIVYNQAFQFIHAGGGNKVRSFRSSLTFSIQTTSSYGKCGDGLAFFITSDLEPPPNSTGRYLGLQSQYGSFRGSHSTTSPSSTGRFLAVEFDTFQNPEFSDPSASHIGIDFNSLNSSAYLDTSGNNTCCRDNIQDNKLADSAVCPLCNETVSKAQKPYSNMTGESFKKSFYPELFLYSNYTFTAWIEYDASEHLIQLWMTNRSTDERPAEPCLSITYDLSEIFLPQMYVGLSAASGNNFEGTTVYSWNFTLLGKEPELSHRGMMITLVLVATVVVTMGTVACILAASQRRTNIKKELQLGRRLERLPNLEMSSISMPRYTYSSLRRAAQGFNERAKVGEGGFSSVYKGILKDKGQVVAIKRLKDGVRMEAEFASEVQIISQMRHRNLMQLQGWCYEKGEALLVYQFMPNGSLDSYLFGSKRDSHDLDSETRLKILIGVAAALEYLHGGLGECVLHRDLKAANVLLTDNFEAMLGDFGLARLIKHDQVVTMTAAGTPGYVAPELIYTGRATDKADVYGFGVLALEMACGSRILDPCFETRLSDRVWSLHQDGNVMNALDPRLKLTVRCATSQADEKEEERALNASMDSAVEQGASMEFRWRCVLHLGLLCCQPCSDARPNMRQVHQALQENTLLPLPPLRPMYAPSFDFSNLSSCILSVGNSGPIASDKSVNSPSDDKLHSSSDAVKP